MREPILAEQTHDFIRSRQWSVAVLPFGATEPHNLHMPYGTDNYQLDAIATRVCQRAFDAGANVLLLPNVPFGVNTNYLDIPGAVACSLTPVTLLHILTDIVESLERQGIHKILLLNGHGGNELKPLTRQLFHKTKAFLCVCDWFRMANDITKDIFDEPGEHADEVETSLGLAYFPELVHLEQADDGQGAKSRFEAIDRGWVSISRPWHLATTNTGMGNPKKATAEKGERLMEVLVDRLSQFLIDLAGSEMDEMFPFENPDN